jgi:hypothetical protein
MVTVWAWGTKLLGALPWFHLTSVDPPQVKNKRVIITHGKPSVCALGEDQIEVMDFLDEK